MATRELTAGLKSVSKVFGLWKSSVDVLGVIQTGLLVGERNWRNERIRMGDTWVPIESKISSGTALFRAQTVVKDSRIAMCELSSGEFDVCTDLEQLKRLSQLVKENEDLFAADPKLPSRTNMCEHAIETGDAAPIKERSRRVPPKLEVEIERQLEEMLKNGVCRPSHSPWASNVVLVRKRDGSFAIDYRRSNGVAKKDAYSLPNMNSILDKLGGSRYFSFIEIASAYCCVPVRI